MNRWLDIIEKMRRNEICFLKNEDEFDEVNEMLDSNKKLFPTRSISYKGKYFDVSTIKIEKVMKNRTVCNVYFIYGTEEQYMNYIRRKNLKKILK